MFLLDPANFDVLICSSLDENLQRGTISTDDLFQAFGAAPESGTSLSQFLCNDITVTLTSR
jgi:hypothetical protein